VTVVPAGAVAGSAAGGAAAGGATASAQTFAYGFLVFEPEEFLRLVSKTDSRAVVVLVKKRKGIVNRKDVYIYVAKYGDFTILTRSETPLSLPSNAELIASKDLTIPPAVMRALKLI